MEAVTTVQQLHVASPVAHFYWPHTHRYMLSVNSKLKLSIVTAFLDPKPPLACQ